MSSLKSGEINDGMGDDVTILLLFQGSAYLFTPGFSFLGKLPAWPHSACGWVVPRKWLSLPTAVMDGSYQLRLADDGVRLTTRCSNPTGCQGVR